MKNGLILIFSLLSLSGCMKKQETQLSSSRVLNIGAIDSPASLEPSIGTNVPASTIIPLLYEGLLRRGLKGELISGTAESYKLSSDGTIYTFYLRNTRWSNGDPVTAYDFEYAWKKVINPKFGSKGATNFYVIKNVPACLSGKVSIEEVGIQALNEKTLRVELEHPACYFPSYTTQSTYAPIHKKTDAQKRKKANNSGISLITNGAFYLEDWKEREFLLLKKNPLYWDQGQVRLAGICIQIIPDLGAQFYLFEKGELDWIGNPLSTLSIDLVRDSPLAQELKQVETSTISWLFVNTEKAPFNNKNFRKALAYAINRQEIVNHLALKGSKPATTILGSFLSLENKPHFKDGDTEKANEYLAIALKELGITLNELPLLELTYGSTPHNKSQMEEIQQQWKKALGLNVSVRGLEWRAHFEEVAKGDYQLGKMGWSSGIDDPIYMLNTFRYKSSTSNMSRWEYPLYQSYLDQSDQELDIQDRRELLKKAEAVLMEEMPLIPIAFDTAHYLHTPSLKNAYLSPLLELNLRYAYFEEK